MRKLAMLLAVEVATCCTYFPEGPFRDPPRPGFPSGDVVTQFEVPHLDSIFADGQGHIWGRRHFSTGNYCIDERTLEGKTLPISGQLAICGNAVWRANLHGWPFDHTIEHIDPKTMTPIASLNIHGRLKAFGGALYLEEFRWKGISRIDPQKDEVAARAELDGEPGRMAVGASGVWFHWIRSGKVAHFDARSLAMLGRVDVCESLLPRTGTPEFMGLVVGDDAAWMICEGSSIHRGYFVIRVSASTHSVTMSADLPYWAFDLAYWRQSLWASCAYSMKHPNHQIILRIDPNALEVLGQLDLPKILWYSTTHYAVPDLIPGRDGLFAISGDVAFRIEVPETDSPRLRD